MAADETGVSPLYLAHHEPRDYDRCVRVGSVHLCRRCLLLWPITFAVLALALAGIRWPTALDVPILIAVPIPATFEFVLEHWGLLPYRPSLELLVTPPLAAAIGIGLHRYLFHPDDNLFWGVVVVHTFLWGTASTAATLVNSDPGPTTT